MARKKKKPQAQVSALMQWDFGPDIPNDDFFEGQPVTNLWNLQEAVETFVYWLEDDRFLAWEAVVCQEQKLPLTAQQREALEGLLCFDEPGDRVLYINDIPRPSEPWHVILNRL